jgi:hypothetical protein
MFDNLRDLSDSSFYEEEQNDLYKEPAAPEAAPVARNKSSAAPKKRSRSRSSNFLGMTPMQRFILSLMLMFTVLIMGTLAMFVLGRMSLF